MGQPPSEKGNTMENTIQSQYLDVVAQIEYIINCGLSDQCETRLESLIERAENLKEQLN